MRALFLICRWPSLRSVLTWQREQRQRANSVMSLLLRSVIPSRGPYSYNLIYTYLSPKGPIFRYYHIRGKIQKLGERTQFSPKQVTKGIFSVVVESHFYLTIIWFPLFCSHLPSFLLEIHLTTLNPCDSGGADLSLSLPLRAGTRPRPGYSISRL